MIFKLRNLNKGTDQFEDLEYEFRIRKVDDGYEIRFEELEELTRFIAFVCTEWKTKSKDDVRVEILYDSEFEIIIIDM